MSAKSAAIWPGEEKNLHRKDARKRKERNRKQFFFLPYLPSRLGGENVFVVAP
jgi:hypothetical protein